MNAIAELWGKIPRIIRKLIFLAFAIGSCWLPYRFALVGADMESWLINGLNQVPVMHSTPGMARANTYHWATGWWRAGLALTVLIWIACIVYLMQKSDD